ncbi:MAG: hypothetical protein QMB61_02325 [Clostridiaceae bacterium]
MIRFVQSGNLMPDDPGTLSVSEENTVLRLEYELDYLIQLVKEWDADLLFLVAEKFDPDQLTDRVRALFRDKLAQIPQVRIISPVGSKVSDVLAKNKEQIPENIFLMTEFESLYLDELGLALHGGFVRREGNSDRFLPNLKHIHSKWPNFLLLPLSASSELNSENEKELRRFDYCTLRPWINLVSEQVSHTDDDADLAAHCILGSLMNGQIQLKKVKIPDYHS